ncbi:MAG: tryptophan--tRNA ligase [Patescibacteria group bacterium]|jgi:tryptophanyl-tRNA synthetase
MARKKTTKPIIFSGIQPSGNLHLGNYLGAIVQWVELQDQYDCVFCVVDYHAITVKQDPKILKEKIVEIAKIYLASGIDPKKSIIFQQSARPEHTELAWILNTITRMSDLFRMTQFKDKSGAVILKKKLKIKHKEKINGEVKSVREDVFEIGREKLSPEEYSQYLLNRTGVGLFDYPVLMAADILLYDTDLVPVGEDQSQHVELCRTLARRFNQQFNETFKIPEVKIKEESARIMGLDDPAKKMSKSASSENNYIALTDSPEKAGKKITRAVTDSGSEVKYDKIAKPAISNLMTIYSLLANTSFENIEKKYKGKGYGEFKKDLAEIVVDFLTAFQKKYNAIPDEEVKKILAQGAEKLAPIAKKNMEKVKNNIGVLLE